MDNTVTFVTGLNETYFPNYLSLSAILAEASSGYRLLVCDYGLSAGQRAFLAEQGVLLSWDMAPKAHPLTLKACMAEYLGDQAVAPVVWIDVDTVPTTDP